MSYIQWSSALNWNREWVGLHWDTGLLCSCNISPQEMDEKASCIWRTRNLVSPTQDDTLSRTKQVRFLTLDGILCFMVWVICRSGCFSMVAAETAPPFSSTAWDLVYLLLECRRECVLPPLHSPSQLNLWVHWCSCAANQKRQIKPHAIWEYTFVWMQSQEASSTSWGKSQTSFKSVPEGVWQCCLSVCSRILPVSPAPIWLFSPASSGMNPDADGSSWRRAMFNEGVSTVHGKRSGRKYGDARSVCLHREGWSEMSWSVVIFVRVSFPGQKGPSPRLWGGFSRLEIQPHSTNLETRGVCVCQLCSCA